MAVGQFTLAEAAKLLNEASITRKIADEQVEAEIAVEYTQDLVQYLRDRAEALEAQAVRILLGPRT